VGSFGKKSSSAPTEGGEREWPTRIVLTVGATAKSNRVKGSPKAARHTAAIIAGTPVLLQASANADTPVASRANTDGGFSAAIRPLKKCEISSRMPVHSIRTAHGQVQIFKRVAEQL
jgi:hypothetical protein